MSENIADSVDYKEVTTLEQLEELVALGKRHYEEVESRAAKMVFDLDIGTIVNMVDLGQIKIFGVYLEDVLIGYCAGYIGRDLYNKNALAEIFALFVEKDYRRSNIAETVLYLFEDCISEHTDVTFLMSFQIGHNTHFPDRVGYKAEEIRYQKIVLNGQEDHNEG